MCWYFSLYLLAGLVVHLINMYSTIGPNVHGDEGVISGNGFQIYAIIFTPFIIIMTIFLVIIIMVCYKWNVRSKKLTIEICADDGPVKDRR